MHKKAFAPAMHTTAAGTKKQFNNIIYDVFAYIVYDCCKCTIPLSGKVVS